MKKYLSLLLLLVFWSCTDKTTITIFDEYFVSMLNIDVNKIYGEVKVIDLSDFEKESLGRYDKINLSPLVYKYNKEYIDSLNIEVSILYGSIYSNKAYNQLFYSLREVGDIKNISVIINETSYDENIKLLDEVEAFLKLSIFTIDSSTEKNDIDTFILENSQTDLWIIDSKRFDYFLYDKLSTNRIVLREGLKISDINDNVLYSLYTDVNQNIYDAIENDSNLIELKLKKN